MTEKSDVIGAEVLSAIKGLRKDYKDLQSFIHSVDKGLVEVNTNYSWVISQLQIHTGLFSDFGIRLEKVEKATGINKTDNHWQTWLLRSFVAFLFVMLGYFIKG